MHILGIIPARYASTRFPGKPLAMIAGMSMIQRVYQACALSSVLSELIVATDDERIFQHVRSFGGKAMLTSERHNSGTERCAEVCGQITGNRDALKPDLVINIQGDEPFIHPDQIQLLAGCFADESTNIATLGKRITREEDLKDPNTVKLVCDCRQQALYFSRSPIPFFRGASPGQWLASFPYLKHIGIYAYRSDTLMEIVKLPPSSLETAESLEQLRWLEHAYHIRVALTQHDSISVDVPEDLHKFEANP